jgi:hypothetical protein
MKNRLSISAKACVEAAVGISERKGTIHGFNNDRSNRFWCFVCDRTGGFGSAPPHQRAVSQMFAIEAAQGIAARGRTIESSEGRTRCRQAGR